MDSVSKERRSEIMGRVRNKDTRPEKVVRSLLHRLGYRFRLHAKGLPGRPDVVLPKYRAVVFIHGCFWHRHPGCPNTRTPKSRVEFWTRKFDENVARDRTGQEALATLGWRSLVIWECETADLERLAERLQAFLEASCDP
jgi:DNA mismatch endonuclease, patch repair protein